MQDVISNCIKLFEDDIQLIKAILPLSDYSPMQSNIEALEEWVRLWQIRFHPNKCKVLRVVKNYPAFVYTMNGNDNIKIDLKVIDTEKDLGVYEDSNIFFREHINKTVLMQINLQD